MAEEPAASLDGLLSNLMSQLQSTGNLDGLAEDSLLQPIGQEAAKALADAAAAPTDGGGGGDEAASLALLNAAAAADASLGLDEFGGDFSLESEGSLGGLLAGLFSDIAANPEWLATKHSNPEAEETQPAAAAAPTEAGSAVGSPFASAAGTVFGRDLDEAPSTAGVQEGRLDSEAPKSAEGRTIAIVTGGNKGIGKAIVKGLAKQPNWLVIATTRNRINGNIAYQSLVDESGVDPAAVVFHELDLDLQQSVENFVDWFRREYCAQNTAGGGAGLGVLVNNAAIQIEAGASVPSFKDQAGPTMRTNFTQTVALTEALLPEMTQHGQQTDPDAAAWADSSDELRARLLDCKTAAELHAMAAEFVACAQAGTEGHHGWAHSSYGASKMLLIQYAKLLAHQCNSSSSSSSSSSGTPSLGSTVAPVLSETATSRTRCRNGVLVNACCPGFCATQMTMRKGVTPKGADMSQDRGQQSADDGADTPIWLATLPAGEKGLNGGMFQSRKLMDAPGWW